jgi:hypothetical protein
MSLVKAKLSDNNGHELEVQFNPESLSIEHKTFGEDSRKRPGEQSARGGAEEAGQSTVKTGYTTSISAVTLLFDTSDSGQNVRDYTLVIAEMMKPDKNVVPVVTLQWGSLIFKVNINGFTEELTYFSDQGVPLRAKVNLDLTEALEERASNNITSQNSGLGFAASASVGASIGASAGFSAGASAGFSAGASAGFSAGASVNASVGASVTAGLNAGASIGTTPLSFSQGGQSLQSMAAQAGVDWKVVAEANDIDNPRLLQAGAAVNLNLG